MQTEPPVVTISQPLQKEITDYDVYTGRLEAIKTIEVRARVKGELIAVRFADGAVVNAGDLLFEIDPRTYQATLDAALARKANAEANLGLAIAEYDRTLSLYKQNAASAKDVQVWIAKKGVAEADIALGKADIDRAKLDLEFAKIRSPITGKISKTAVVEGNLINIGAADMLLTTIVSIDPMYVYFDVPERALLNYQNAVRKRAGKGNGKNQVAAAQTYLIGQTAGAPAVTPLGVPLAAAVQLLCAAQLSGIGPQIPVELALTVDTGAPIKGIIDFIDNKVNPNTGTINVRARFDNPIGADGRYVLTAGLFARVRIAVAEPYKAILVADRAILSDQTLKYVLVLDKADKNSAKRVDIEPADRAQGNGLRAVRAGLKGDEWVIVEGVNRARPGAAVTPKEEPMPYRPAKGK